MTITEQIPERAIALNVSSLTIERAHKIVVSNFNLKADKGEIVQIIGKNGSGKSSILRTISGLAPIFEGSVKWLGLPIQAQDSYVEKVNYLGHLSGLSRELTGLENLVFYASISRSKKPALSVIEALSVFDACNLTSKFIKYLSAGEKQKLVLARMLMFNSPLWLLDEPFSSLDASTQRILEDRMDEHVSKGGTILITSHQPFKTVHPLKSVII